MSTPFRPRLDPRPDIVKALDRAIELSVGTRRYQISAGRLVYERHRRCRYTFTLARGSWDLPDGTDLQLASSDLAHPLPVELYNTKDDAVTITVTQRLTERTLTSAHLMVERAFLLRKLKEAFLCESTQAQCGLKLLGVLDCADVEAEAYLVESIKEVFPADEAQLLAMRRALYSELLMVMGPPGTGKTDVLAAIALLHATLFNNRVLIVSHTNIAIDTAVLRLVKFLRKLGLERFLDQQRLVRYGNPHLAELETDEYRSVTMPLIVADLVAQNREEADWEKATRQLGQLELSYQNQWTSYDAEHKKLKRLRKHRWLVRFAIQMWTDEWEKDLKETVQALATPLQQLARQMDALRLDQRQALNTYQQARQRWDALIPPIAYWERERDRPPRWSRRSR